MALTYGAHGDVIPTKTGYIDRQALLGTEIIGANYWSKVDNGRVMNAFNQQEQKLSSQIEDGMALHLQMTIVRGQAAPGVVAVSDLFGGASFPSIDAWQLPSQLLVSAMQMRNAGSLWGASLILGIVAVLVRNAAKTLNAYVDDTQAGAAFSAKALKVIKTSAEIIDAVLSVYGAAGFVAGAGDAAADVALKKGVARYVDFVPQPQAASVSRAVSSSKGGLGMGKFL